MHKSLSSRLLGEFIGTYLLVLTVGCNNQLGDAENPNLWGALSIASVLMVSIYALGSVSGANFNPAVSLGLFLVKQPGFDAGTTCAYMATQVIAGCTAGLTFLFMHGEAKNLAPAPGFHAAGAAAVEIAYTFMLVFVVLRAAISSSNPDNNEYFGLAIGFVIIAGGYAAGWISGGCFNPAVAIGLDVASASEQVFWCFFYTMFEFVGAVVAVCAHYLVEDDRVVSSKAGRIFISEFIGTFFLVFTVGLNVLGANPLAAISIGASLMCMIYALGSVSGAHFNPAVTTAIVLTGTSDDCTLAAMPIYVLAQCLGGVAAAFSYVAITGRIAQLKPGEGYTWIDASMAEIIYTFVLCFVVLNVACLPKTKDMSKGGNAKQLYGFAIGACIWVGGTAIGGVSGGSLNPAVSLALDASSAFMKGGFMNCVPYACFEIIGASLAATLFWVVRDEVFAKDGRLPLSKKTDSYGTL
jgi:aquaporin Z